MITQRKREARGMVRWPLCIGLLAVCVLLGSTPARASIEKLQETQVPMLVLLIEAFEVEGESYNILNETVSAPSFHSARWNPASKTMEWRFWVPLEGTLAGELRKLSRKDAVALLKSKMNDLAIFVGVEAMPGFEQPIGCLQTANVPGRDLISEADWTTAQKQLADVSVIRLAAAHKEGPILLVRKPNGRIIEEQVEMPAPKAAVR